MVQNNYQVNSRYLQGQNNCSTENCQYCHNKRGCQQYLSYLENIATSPTIKNTNQDVTAVVADISKVVESAKLTADSITETLENKFLTMESKFNKVLDENTDINTKLDYIIGKLKNGELTSVETVPNYSTDNIIANSSLKNINMLDDNIADENNNSGLIVYDGNPMKTGDTYFEEKKTIFGKTKMVEKTVK